MGMRVAPPTSTISSRLFQSGNGGRTKPTRQTVAMANRKAPTSSGGRLSVASLPAALLMPQTTMIARIAPISSRVRACGLGEAAASGVVMSLLCHAAPRPSAHFP